VKGHNTVSTETNKPKPIVHFEIVGTDSLPLQSFYKDLFDWPLQNVSEMDYGLLMKEATGTIGGGVCAVEDANARGTTIYIEVDDLQAYLDKAEALGGKTMIPPTEIPNMVTFAQFMDPQGNRIGMVKSNPA
jgi:uncharacterized protein